ncbi:polysaccharide deacetylase family protein [Evansella sp. AB-P1]|uniref:polysaccharide deacetylase family protein n=1 Tax=Evansella sp. AB-P1 TaxID=3037653 RepID=UPI00241C5D06|nr:polysaccharide deacetylase family protein [Evansella sp. AB-P1]MDG5787818.1 polysaccharide deacetylase family protein [Evansella sp. AB-P1]
MKRSNKMIVIFPLLAFTLLVSFLSYYFKHDNVSNTTILEGHHIIYSMNKKEILLPSIEEQHSIAQADIKDIKNRWESESLHPTQWGEQVTGVKNKLETNDHVIALTFDACGGPYGSGYDEKLIRYLRENNIPATLFINARWIKENRSVFLELSEDPLFYIENHGTEHLPLSINGGTAWGISGTKSVEEVIAEVMENQLLISEITGRKPSFFRSGTAYYDEVAVNIVNDLGLSVVNYNVLGDAGATFTSEQVKNSLLASQPGSIVLLHMNQPTSGTAEGIIEAIPILQQQGFEFVTLYDYSLSE